MCLIVFAYQSHPEYDFILAANRDEFYERPTQTARWWEDHPEILGGRDLKAMGTWMGIDRKGRFSAVTNFRDISNIKEDAKSRGDLPLTFLKNSKPSMEIAEQIKRDGTNYNGFNLLMMGEEMIHVSNYQDELIKVEPGIHGLSNALLNTSWPKVDRAKTRFQEIIDGSFEVDELMQLMQDTDVAKDEELPETGLNLEMERAVSAMCIRTPNYGTCCTTVITIKGNEVQFIEKSYPVGNRKDEIVNYSFSTSQ